MSDVIRRLPVITLIKERFADGDLLSELSANDGKDAPKSSVGGNHVDDGCGGSS